jgi:hypothetical protein
MARRLHGHVTAAAAADGRTLQLVVVLDRFADEDALVGGRVTITPARRRRCAAERGEAPA